MAANRMIHIGRARDVVEKNFMFLKSYFDLRKTGVHSDATYEGKMFVAFISLVVLQSFRWYTKKLLNIKSSETTATLVAELRKYKIQRKKDDTWMPLYAINKQQKEILQYLSITEEDAIKKIKSLSISKALL